MHALIAGSRKPQALARALADGPRLRDRVRRALRLRRDKGRCVRQSKQFPRHSGSRRNPDQDLAMNAYIPLILFTVLTNAAAQLMLKRGMTGVGNLDVGGDGLVSTVFRVVFNPFVFAGLATFVVSMASHLIVLSKVQISYAYPFLSLAYVVVAVYAYFVFQEDLSPARIAGIGLIMLGTIFIAQS